MEAAEAVRVNRVFHDHECDYYDERFAIVHDGRSARQARAEVERLLGRALRPGEVVLDPGCGTGWQAAGLRRATSSPQRVGAARAGRPWPGWVGRPGRVGRGGLAGWGGQAARDGRAGRVAGGMVIGVDLSAGMLDRARAAGAWPLLQADATRLPVAAGSIDVVVSRGVLHHLPDVPAALAEWRRVLRPGGAVVVAAEPTPAVERHAGPLVQALLAALHRPLTAEEDFWEVASMAANLHVFTPGELARMARAAGFAEAALTTSDLLSTLVLTASYVTHGRRRELARRVPWRGLEAAGRWLDRLVVDRVLAQRLRHTVVGVLRA
jgi:ubiquinone/menaquinone biosynthesis C-methylase UbiE